AELLRHPPEDRQLLGVLLPEHREVRAAGQEELGHDRRDPLEVAGPKGPAEAPVEVADPYGREGREPERVQRFHAGREDDVHAALGRQRSEAGVGRAGVARVVLARREVRRGDEGRDGDVVGPPLRRADEREVALVERPHRRYQRETTARSPRPVGAGLHGIDGVDQLHGSVDGGRWPVDGGRKIAIEARTARENPGRPPPAVEIPVDPVAAPSRVPASAGSCRSLRLPSTVYHPPSMDYRIERDSLGEVRVPADALYGAQTQRAKENFPISDLRFPRRFIEALGTIKAAAARANAELGLLDADM